MSSSCAYSTQGTADVYCPIGCTATVISFSVQQSGQVVLSSNSTCNATFYVLANNQQVGNFLQGQIYNLYAQPGVTYTITAQVPPTGFGTCSNTVFVCSTVPFAQQPPPLNYMQYVTLAIIAIAIIAILYIIYTIVKNVKVNLAVPVPV